MGKSSKQNIYLNSSFTIPNSISKKCLRWHEKRSQEKDAKQARDATSYSRHSNLKRWNFSDWFFLTT